MSIVKIELFGEESIGRFYQLAALSIAHQDRGLAGKIEKGLLTGQIDLTLDEANKLFELLVDYVETRACPVKPNFKPTLYRAGLGDRSILSSMGFPGGEALTCSELVKYYRLGSFTQMFSKEVSVPTFIRAYVFSRYRGMKEVSKTTATSLYLALIGLFIAAVGRFRKGNETFELYVNPDGSLETLRSGHVMYGLLNEPGSVVKPHDVVADVLQLDGVSLELSSLLALTLYVYQVSKLSSQLAPLSSYYNLFERFRLICVNPGDRPLVVWERALTLTHLIQRLNQLNALDLLESLDSSIGYVSRLKKIAKGRQKDRAVDNVAGEYSEAVATCINDIYGFLETNALDGVIRCVGGLSRVHDSLNDLYRKKRDQTIHNAAVAASVLLQRVVRLASGVR